MDDLLVHYFCLTLHQPWAWALFHAGKDVENRRWATSFRGRLFIHTSQITPRRKYDEGAAFIIGVTGVAPPPYHELDHGAIIGSVEVTACVTACDSPWFFGPYGFLLRDARLLALPTAAKGALGIWQWKAD